MVGILCSLIYAFQLGTFYLRRVLLLLNTLHVLWTFRILNLYTALVWMISIKRNWVPTLRPKLLCELSSPFVSTPLKLSLSFKWNTLDLLGIMMGSYYSQLQESGSTFNFVHSAERWTLLAGCPPQPNALGCILSLEHYSACAKDYSCNSISWIDWTSNFFLFSDVLLGILNADDAVQSIFSLFISLAPKKVIMSIERLNFRLRLCLSLKNQISNRSSNGYLI